MQENIPLWLCQACQDKFHISCLNPSSCQFDNQMKDEESFQAHQVQGYGISHDFDLNQASKNQTRSFF